MSSEGSRGHSSRSSYSAGTGASSAASTDGAGLATLEDREKDASVQELLDQNKGFWDAVFSCLLLLTKNRSVTSYRMLAFRVAIEYLQLFKLVHNTQRLWLIDEKLWADQAIRWVLFRFIIMDLEYAQYVRGAWFLGCIVLLLVASAILITYLLRTSDLRHVWLNRMIQLVQTGVLFVFSIFWVAVFDYFAFMFTCDWKDNHHRFWQAMTCTTNPHLQTTIFAGACGVTLAACVLCLAMADCTGNLITNNLVAMTEAETAFKTTALKVALIVASTCLGAYPKTQAILMLLCPVLSLYYQVRSAPYLLSWMNHLWTGLWLSLIYATSLLAYLNFDASNDPDHVEHDTFEADEDEHLRFRAYVTTVMQIGVFPAVILGMLLSWLIHRWRESPLKKFAEAQKDAAEGKIQLETIKTLKSIHRFTSPKQVEFLARCVRKFEPVTELPTPEAVALSGLVIQAGLARYPGDSTLLVVYANYVIYVKKQPRAARQQLQLAAKNSPGIIDRYNMFRSMDELKHDHRDEDSGLDLIAYVEQQRGIRACMKAHKLALLAQRAFWRALIRSDDIKMADVLTAFKKMHKAERTAVHVYKRVLERYPQNGKLLKIWGRFQEWVLHDPARAAKSYAESLKQGMGDNLLALTSDSTDQTNVSLKDTKNAGLVIIDASGTMLLVDKAAYTVFGYNRGELEDKNVSMLMPQPYSGQHNAYLNNYLTTGVAKILDQHKQFVGIRKDRSVFPVDVWVRRLSGTGQESIFMGVIRPLDDSDTSVVRVWTTSAGLVLCSDGRFTDWFGVPSEELVGRSFSSLTKFPPLVERFLTEAGRMAKEHDADAANQSIQTTMLHRYLQCMDVEISISYAGSDAEPLLVLNIRCLTAIPRVLVLDAGGNIQYATSTMAALVGYKVPQLVKKHVKQLIPPPTSQLHDGWMKVMGSESHHQWAGSCRGGTAVQLLAANGTKVLAKLDISAVEEMSGDRLTRKYVVKVTKSTQDEFLDGRRLKFVVNQRGRIIHVLGSTPKSLFGFEPEDLVGRRLAAFIPQFEQFATQYKSQQKQFANTGIASLPVSQPVAHDNHSAEAVSGALSLLMPDDRVGDACMLLMLIAKASQEGTDASYRVDVRTVLLEEDEIGKSVDGASETHSIVDVGAGAGEDQHSKFLRAILGGRKSSTKHPAAMKVEVLGQDWSCDGTSLSSSIAGGVLFAMELWRADMLVGMLEVDQHLKVVSADAAMGHMLGCASNAIRKKLLNKLVKLPSQYSTPLSLLAPSQLQKAASALKTKSKGEALVGPELKVDGWHADGLGVKLVLQAVSKDSSSLGSSLNRALIRVKLAEPLEGGSLEAMLRLLGATVSLPEAVTRQLAASTTTAAQQSAAGPAASGRLSRANSRPASNAREREFDSDADTEAAPGRNSRRQPGELWPRLQDGDANSETEAECRLPGYVPEQSHSTPAAGHHNSKSSRRASLGTIAESEAGIDCARSRRSSAVDDDATEVATDVASVAYTTPNAIALRQLAGDSESETESVDDKGVDAVTADTFADDGGDISCDWSRAKRLKCIVGQLESAVARAPLFRFWRGMLLAALLLFAARLAFYSSFCAQVAKRQTDVIGVQQLASAADNSQVLLLQANLITKCGRPSSATLGVCSPALQQTYKLKQMEIAKRLVYYHQGVFFGYDVNNLQPMADPKLLDYWIHPIHEEYNYADTMPPIVHVGNASLIVLGNRYIYANFELAGAALGGMPGPALEQTSNWKYVSKNGLDSIFQGYYKSLDMYVRFCYEGLGFLSKLLGACLGCEMGVIALAVLAWQMSLIRRVAGQRMACFSVFLSLPTAMLRTLATAVCKVDDEDAASDAEAEELSFEIASASQAVESGVAGSSKQKAVRMSVNAGVEGARQESGSDSAKRRVRRDQKSTGALGWITTKYLQARRAGRGVLNRPLKVNGKQLQPARGVFARFMIPMLCWWLFMVGLYAVAALRLPKLQAPLMSLQSAAHVQFLIVRTRALVTALAFMTSNEESAVRENMALALRAELADLKQEYFTMLYGGPVATSLSLPPMTAPAAVFEDPAVSRLFFKTTECLRQDKSGCFDETSPWYSVTHTGLDPMIKRFMSDVEEFVLLPPWSQNASAASYDYMWQVAPADMYDGMLQASNVFVGTTLNALNELHIMQTCMAVITVVGIAVFVFGLLMPYKRELTHESIRLAGLLSLLPQEANVEGQIKLYVVNVAANKENTQQSRQWLTKGLSAARAAAAAAAAAARAAAAAATSRRERAADGADQHEDNAAARDYYGIGYDDGSSDPDWD